MPPANFGASFIRNSDMDMGQFMVDHGLKCGFGEFQV
jgi:hypothetical protein